MFKKTLVATSLMALASPLLADTLAPAQVHSAAITAAAPGIQAIATADDVAVTGPILHLDANVSAGDTIAVTYIGAALDEDHTFATTKLTVGTTTGGTGAACVTANQDVSFAGQTGNVATFRVNATNGITVNCTLALPNVTVDGASLAAADTFSISTTTSTPYGVLQSVAATKLVDVGPAEITSVVTTKFDDEVKVATARNALGAATDVAVFTLADTSDAAGALILATSTMSVAGDFSWASVTDAEGVKTYPGVTLSAAATGLVVTDTSASWVAPTLGAYTMTLTPPTALVADAAYPQTGVKTLSKGTYTFSSDIRYKNEEAATVAVPDSVTESAGAWTIDGASVTAFGIPKSSSVTPFLWVQNKGTLSGDVTVDVRCDGVTTSGIAAGTAAGLSNTSIGAAVKTAMDAVATCGATSRYDADITVNASDGNIEVLAGYKVTAADGSNDRLQLETTNSLND